MHRLTAASSVPVLAILLVAAAATSVPARGTTYELRSGRAQDAVDLVQAVLEVGGDLRMVEEGEESREKMNVVAKFVYDEKSLQIRSQAGVPTRAVRHYYQADGEIQSGEHRYKPKLRDERRLIGVEVDGPDVTLFSPEGTLTSEELELIDVLGNTLLLDRLLPDKPLPLNGQWQHPDDLIAAMLGLDAITESNVKSVLTGVADGKARLEVSGHIAGAEDGVSTEVELKGRYHFDLKAKRITWFGLLVQENRSVGHVDTGFDVVARLQMRITPGRKSAPLSDTALANLPLEATPELTRLSYEPPEGNWRLAHDRRWFVITEEDSQAVLRLIDGGDKLAQCNVALLPPDAHATQLTLERFQEDVVRALDESFEKVLRASQRHSEADYRVFQVVAEGEASDLPMQWIYYLVIDEQGRRVVLAFVLEKQMLGRFEGADEALVASLRLAEPKIASKPDNDQPSAPGKR